jgi:response regulator RpfG family c-di-GMP phosphodiesterase
MKFLIVDDDDDIREILSIMVSSNYDVEVFQSNNGQNAIDTLNSDGPFDLVICDFNMPKKNGADVYKELRRIKESTPFILISTDFDLFKKNVPKIEYCDWIEKPFNESDITNKIETLMSQKIIPPQTESYLPVSLEVIEKIEIAGVSLFLKLNQSTYIKVLKDDATFDKNESIRFRNKKITHLYIELLDIKLFIYNFRKNIFSRIDWNNVDTTEAVENLNTDWSLILEGSRSFGWSDSLKNLAKENIAKTISLIGKNPQLKKIFDKIKISQSQSKNTPHCYTLVFLTTAILKQLTWDSPRTVQKMTFAALLHDMELNDLMFSNKLNLIATNKLNADINQQANYLIYNHPNTAAEFVNRWTSCPPDVDKLILQHHEKFDGTGFPHKLSFLKIFPLAGIFIMAEDLIYSHMNHPEKKLETFLKENESYYSRGDFKKIYQAVLKVVQGMNQ